jgi:phospholipid N-methyltransferase
MTEQNTENGLTIGAPVIGIGGSRGYIAAIREPAAVSYALGSGTMTRNRAEVEIVFPAAGHVSIVPDSIAAPWIEAGKRANIPPADDIAGMVAAAREAEAKRREEMNAEHKARKEREATFYDDAERRIPSWAKAAIIAEQEQDDCDSMSDYYNAKTVRRVVIGWSKHARDLFPEMRSAAATFPETAHLATAPENAEHREKWSMGAGYYLKDGSRYSSGWKVSKRTFYGETKRQWAQSLNVAEFHLPEDRPAAPMPQAAAPGAIAIEEHTHTKKGFQMFLCILGERVEREAFESLRDKAQAMGGWYSRPWGKTPGGFAFRDRATAEAFAALDQPAADSAESPSAPSAAATSPRSGGGEHMAGKLRTLAESMTGAIEHAFRDRLENTPKRQREGQSARLEGFRLKRAQSGLLALAALHEAGNVPPALSRLTSKARAIELASSVIERSGGYYDAGRDTGKPSLNTPEALAFWELLKPPSEAERKAEELRRAIADLQFANIPGFFPTPPEIVAKMIDRADVGAGMAVLEPSAGTGNILDAIRANHPEHVSLACYEVSHRLRGILSMKGYAPKDDFTDDEPAPIFDRVLMNPPFENGQDMAHVRRAFEWLKPGGRLIAIMSPGPFWRSDRKAVEFREWFDSMGGEREDLPEGSFKASGTGVATVLVEVRK